MIEFRPMSECRPHKNDQALIYVKGMGCLVGTFCPEISGLRHDGTTWRLEDGWYVDGSQGGDFYPHADPDILGWHPIDETAVILP